MLQVLAGFTWWAVLADVLAAARITRLITRDQLPPVRNARQNLLRRGKGSEWSALWVCPWCMSFHVALLILLGHLLVSVFWGVDGAAVWALLLAPLAISHVVGFFAEFEKA